MSLSLYMDHHVHAEITNGLRRSGIDVLTLYEDNRERAADEMLLHRATELKRVLFSQDSDILVHVSQWQRNGRRFTGAIYARQLGITIGECVNDLALICGVCNPQEMENRLIYLPL